jgi:2-deoxy-D-gluconate 3-dehydrogenase
MSIFDLKGKVSIVTGGFRGIGKVLATGLKEFGAEVIVVDIQAEKDNEEPEGMLFLRCDISKKKEIDESVALILEKFQRIDILVNNAGIIRSFPAIEMPLAEWEAVFRVNVTGTFLFSQAVGRQMIRQGKGKIINIASNQSEAGVESFVAYGASKGAVLALTRTLAIEWAKHGINVNAVSPAATWSPMTEKKFADKQILEKYIKDIPMGRVLVPSDLVGAVVFLASDASDMVTGHNLHVDGGYLAK